MKKWNDNLKWTFYFQLKKKNDPEENSLKQKSQKFVARSKI